MTKCYMCFQSGQFIRNMRMMRTVTLGQRDISLRLTGRASRFPGNGPTPWCRSMLRPAHPPTVSSSTWHMIAQKVWNARLRCRSVILSTVLTTKQIEKFDLFKRHLSLRVGRVTLFVSEKCDLLKKLLLDNKITF